MSTHTRAKLESLLQSIRQLAQDERNNEQLAKGLEEHPQSAVGEHLQTFIRRENRAVATLTSLHNSLHQIIEEVKSISHPNQEQLVEDLQYSYRMLGELSQQEGINASTAQTVTNDPFLQTGQVFSALERLESYAHEGLSEIEQRLTKVARNL
ncbi:hypothetical protein [Effusibacillus consociatus]|uniref:Uncharacterized protein n=1 Tax=Effusibacillus consociatus TaxID=1117041 RepID=A0ABV9Q0V8_9BACL